MYTSDLTKRNFAVQQSEAVIDVCRKRMPVHFLVVKCIWLQQFGSMLCGAKMTILTNLKQILLQTYAEITAEHSPLITCIL